MKYILINFASTMKNIFNLNNFIFDSFNLNKQITMITLNLYKQKSLYIFYFSKSFPDKRPTKIKYALIILVVAMIDLEN
jgi:hypothetical protein